MEKGIVKPYHKVGLGVVDRHGEGTGGVDEILASLEGLNKLVLGIKKVQLHELKLV